MHVLLQCTSKYSNDAYVATYIYLYTYLIYYIYMHMWCHIYIIMYIDMYTWKYCTTGLPRTKLFVATALK